MSEDYGKNNNNNDDYELYKEFLEYKEKKLKNQNIEDEINNKSSVDESKNVSNPINNNYYKPYDTSFIREYDRQQKEKRNRIIKTVVIVSLIVAIVATGVYFAVSYFVNGGSLSKLFPKIFHECEFNEWRETQPATCVADGKKELFCACGKTSGETQVVSINPDNHVDVQWVVTHENNCLESGLQNEQCLSCGFVLQTGVVLPADSSMHKFNILNNSCNVCGEKEYQEITSSSQLENADSKIVILLDYYLDTTTYTEYTIETSEYVRFVGTVGRSYDLRIKIADRTEPVNIDFVNVAISGFGDQPMIYSTSECTINLGFYGEFNSIVGAKGANGTDYGPFRDAGHGKIAIDVNGDLNINVDTVQCNIYGGAGGRGGHGSVGNDGGAGGNGAMAISAKSITVTFGAGKGKNNLSVAGGAGGSGGNPGGWFFYQPVSGYSGYGAVATNVDILYK